MDAPNSISVSNGLYHVALISDDRIGESRMMGASYNGTGRDVSAVYQYVYFHIQGSIEL